MVSLVAGAERLSVGAEVWRCVSREKGGPRSRQLGLGGHLVFGPTVILLLLHLNWDSAQIAVPLSFWEGNRAVGDLCCHSAP